MSFQSDFSDYKRYLTNSVKDTQYITTTKIGRFVNKLKKEGVVESNLEDDKKQYVISYINDNNSEVIKKLEEYEFDKYYKYFTMYKLENFDWTIINTLKSKVEDEYKHICEFNKLKNPIVKEFDDSIDLKFPVIISNDLADYSYGLKYPVIITLYKNINYIIIKYCALPYEYKNVNNIYSKIQTHIKSWIKNVLKCNLIKLDSYDIFRKLRRSIREHPEQFQTESIYTINLIDVNNGKTNLKSNDSKTLPLMDELLDLSKNFKSSEDRELLKKYIYDYEEKSYLIKIGLEWKANFSNNVKDQLGKIIVVLEKFQTDDSTSLNYIHHHIYSDDSINKERIDYVIRYLSDYIKKNI